MGLGLWTDRRVEEGSQFNMGLFSELRARARYVIGPVLGLSAITYFGYHVVHGERGLLAWWQLRDRISTARESLAVIHAEREVLENRVHLLHPENLDPDMLEERARIMLDYGYANEIITIDGKKKE